MIGSNGALRRAAFSAFGILPGLFVFSACGDVSPEDAKSISNTGEPVCPAAPSYEATTLWPQGVIIYTWDTTPIAPIPTSMRTPILEAMDSWQQATGNRIQFQNNQSTTEGIVIKNIYSTMQCAISSGTCQWDLCVAATGRCLTDESKPCTVPAVFPSVGCSADFPVCDGAAGLCRIADGCHSSVGFDPTPGPQEMWLAEGQCAIEHELGHAIGLAHEQDREDRDNFVDVQPEYKGCDYFGRRIARTEDDPINIGPYNLNATMQYLTSDDPETPEFDPPMTVLATGDPITTGMGAPEALDGAKVVEMYSRVDPQWKRAVRVASSVGPIRQGSSPAIAKTPEKLHVFTTGRDGHVYRRATSAYGKPDWGSVQDLGFTAASNPGATSINGKAAVAVRGSGGNVYVAHEIEDWTWDDRGKPSGVTVASDPVLVSTGPDKLHILVRGSDNNLYQKSRTSNGWGGWVSRGGNGTLRGTPAAASLLDGNMHVFSNSATGELIQSVVTGTSWSGWFTVGGGACCLAANSSPTVAYPNAGRLDVLVRGTDNRLRWKRWKPSGWLPFKDLGSLTLSNPSAVALGTARVDTVFVGADERLWYRQHAVGRTKGDFDGDGRGDFALYRPSEKRWHIAPYTGEPAYFVQFSGSVKAGIPDDFDNDGAADPVVFDTSSGVWTWKRSSDDEPFVGNSWGNNSDRLLNGDFNGDGRADYALWRPSDQKVWVAPTNGASPLALFMMATTSDVMVPGDYDGDGITDRAYYRPSEGRWYILSQQDPVQLGWPGDVPVPGDYDGDGKTDAAVFSPSTGGWAYLPSSTGSTVPVAQICSLTTEDRPVPKDYDGDGKTDPAVFSPSGEWKVARSTGGTKSVTFGTGTDVPF
jgi:hypothetical protein